MKKNNFKVKKRLNVPNFHVSSLEDDTLIDLQNGGLDDESEFNCDMYDFGQMDDLPDSDRQMIHFAKRCREYQP